MVRGGDPKLYRRLVGRVVYARQPVVGPVGPVVAKKSAVTIFVFTDDQSVLRFTP